MNGNEAIESPGVEFCLHGCDIRWEPVEVEYRFDGLANVVQLGQCVREGCFQRYRMIYDETDPELIA